MKEDRINNEPPKSNSPLNQTAGPSRFPDVENPRHSYPRFPYSQPGPSAPVRQPPRPVRTLRQVEPPQGATCHKLAGQYLGGIAADTTPGYVRKRAEDTPTARTHLRGHGHLHARTLGREHMTGTDTSMGHVTYVTAGYLYQSWMGGGISPEPELYKCNTIPILVNIAKIVLTSWISI